MRYVLFTKDNCPYCEKAQNLLEKHEKNFKVVNFEEGQEDILQKIKDSCKWKTVPMIFEVSNNTEINFIGGFTDLSNSLEE